MLGDNRQPRAKRQWQNAISPRIKGGYFDLAVAMPYNACNQFADGQSNDCDRNFSKNAVRILNKAVLEKYNDT